MLDDLGDTAAASASAIAQDLQPGQVLRLQGSPTLMLGIRWTQKAGQNNTICDLDCALILSNSEVRDSIALAETAFGTGVQLCL